MYSIIYVMKFDFCSLKLLSLSDNIYLTASEKKMCNAPKPFMYISAKRCDIVCFQNIEWLNDATKQETAQA